ncbi:hypothetical protein PoB_007625700 [Plakobranchus ocellatus]|uniref:Uncharacterized protein n=1 Tax=Plakobranchus ocellatus TaxID=259542 RepID=A0AAV4DZJ4_9GAST|nr:hypothetical protein PoB_007625700 [Plakobranchus ocellatus]
MVEEEEEEEKEEEEEVEEEEEEQEEVEEEMEEEEDLYMHLVPFTDRSFDLHRAYGRRREFSTKDNSYFCCLRSETRSSGDVVYQKNDEDIMDRKKVKRIGTERGLS